MGFEFGLLDYLSCNLSAASPPSPIHTRQDEQESPGEVLFADCHRIREIENDEAIVAIRQVAARLVIKVCEKSTGLWLNHIYGN